MVTLDANINGENSEDLKLKPFWILFLFNVDLKAV